MAVPAPAQPGAPAVPLAVGLEVAFHLVEPAAFIAGAPFPAGAIAGMVVVVGQARLVVGLGRVVLAPVRLLAGGIQHLGDGPASRAAQRLRARAPLGARPPV